jgi:hypothetical protein
MCNEEAARAALRALGIRNPSANLIQHWIQANRAEQEPPPNWRTPPHPTPQDSKPSDEPAEPQNFEPKRLRGYSKSNLEPTLRVEGTLERPRGIREPGRPRVIASWFPAVTKTMADGTPLREALKRHGITLDKRQIRALYRNEEFKRLYREERYRHQHSDLYFKKRLTREERFRRML